MELNHHRSGKGPTLIILHGLFGSWENWRAQIKRLAEHYDTLAVDLRNHGGSPHEEAIDYPLMAADVVELMDRLGIEQAMLLGHSMGGKVAMQLALDHPQRVQKLIVADIAPVAYPRHHDEVFKGLFSVPLDRIRSRTEADAWLAKQIKDQGVRAFLLKNLVRSREGQFGWKMNLDALYAAYDRISAAPSGEGPYTGPVLFIKGGRSDYLKAEYAERIRALFPHASFKVIEGAGHWLHAEKPTAFNRLVENFLAARG